MDIVNGNAPSPGTLKIGLINGCSNLPIKSTNPNPMSISDIIKKGRREGKIILNHTAMPDAALLKESFGLVMIPIKTIITINRKNNVKLNVLCPFLFFIFAPPIIHIMNYRRLI
jgi:hypothetical protein